MELKNCAAFIYKNAKIYIDHLCPLCNILNIPIITTEESDQILKNYPGVTVVNTNIHNLPFEAYKNSVLFSCLTKYTNEKIFYLAQKTTNKDVAFFWCPHGNSDKGHISKHMESLSGEKNLLIYGQQLLDFIKLKGAYKESSNYIFTGDYRYEYYKENILFYKDLISKKIPGAKSYNKIILYAPTWNDHEKSCSFFSAFPLMLKKLPENYFLIVKLHPNLMETKEIETSMLMWEGETKKNIFFLQDFYPINPLLDFVDIYIGDMSSIGYDFLKFNKPMFFLNENDRDQRKDPGLFLYKCGISLKKDSYSRIFEIIEAHLDTDSFDFSDIRRKTYEYVFAQGISPTVLKNSIKNIADKINTTDFFEN